MAPTIHTIGAISHTPAPSFYLDTTGVAIGEFDCNTSDLGAALITTIAVANKNDHEVDYNVGNSGAALTALTPIIPVSNTSDNIYGQLSIMGIIITSTAHPPPRLDQEIYFSILAIGLAIEIVIGLNLGLKSCAVGEFTVFKHEMNNCMELAWDALPSPTITLWRATGVATREFHCNGGALSAALIPTTFTRVTRTNDNEVENSPSCTLPSHSTVPATNQSDTMGPTGAELVDIFEVGGAFHFDINGISI